MMTPSRRVEEVKIELGNEEVDRGGKVFAMVSFQIFMQMISIIIDGYSRQFYVSLLDMLQTYLEIKRGTIPLPFSTDSSHFRNHVQHLLQTHESYLIQWESLLNKKFGCMSKKKFELPSFLRVLRSWRQWGDRWATNNFWRASLQACQPRAMASSLKYIKISSRWLFS